MSKDLTKTLLGWREDGNESSKSIADKCGDDKISKMAAISPSNFHRSSQQQRLEIMNSAEKREISQQVQKIKHEYEIRLKVLRELTVYRKFPLQEPAFHNLDDLMACHLQGRIEQQQQTPKQQIEWDGPILNIGQQEWEDASNKSELSAVSLEDPKRPRQCIHSLDQEDIPLSPSKMEKDKFRKQFLAEVAILPRDTTRDSMTDSVSLFSSPLWCMEPRIFAVEKSNTGKRYYVVAHLARFMDHYFRFCDPTSRHYYEVIRGNTPCRLYFDLEFIKNFNESLTEETAEILVEEFIDALSVEVKQRFDLIITQKNVVDLDSSTDTKFSRHLIVHFPQGKLFTNCISCGRFVKNFIGRLVEDAVTGVLSTRHPTLSQYLFVWKEEHDDGISKCKGTMEPQDLIPTTTTFIDKRKMCFVDLGVYTKNRLFRIWMSCKYGKSTKAALRIASRNQFPVPKNFLIDKENVGEEILDKQKMAVRRKQDAFNWEDHGQMLADSLVVPPNYSKLRFEVLPDDDKQGASLATNQATQMTRTFHSVQHTTYGPSPFPCLDNFILGSLASRGGVVGSIRAWGVIPDRFNNSLKGIITYHMKDNRWCEYIGRHHKGNNIMWNVSLKDMTFWQTCHDPDCRRDGFKGPTNSLPYAVQEELKEAILAKSFEGDTEFEKALMTLSLRNDKSECEHMNEGVLPPATCDTNETSFEDALVEFLKTKPDLCP